MNVEAHAIDGAKLTPLLILEDLRKRVDRYRCRSTNGDRGRGHVSFSTNPFQLSERNIAEKLYFQPLQALFWSNAHASATIVRMSECFGSHCRNRRSFSELATSSGGSPSRLGPTT